LAHLVEKIQEFCMPTLNWIGKEAVVEHHKEVPFHLLRCDPALSVGGPGSGNLLVQADNLLALKALLPYYKGQVKCIYIDPPYNTGNESWVYNDNVSGPEIQAWLGQVVGKEAEDLSRHDKWLCMMYPRLVLLRELLSEDGSFWMSIDDNEVPHARTVLDEIFGRRNFVAMLTWQKRVSPANDAKYFSSDHEYILVYAYDKDTWRPNRLERTQEQLKNYSNPDNDPRGSWNSVTYTGPKSIDERPNLYYGIENPNTGEIIYPKKTAVWKYDKETHLQHVKDNLIYWGVRGTNKMPRLKRFLRDMGKVVPRSVLMYSDCGHTSEARTEILRIISEVPFTTPKPTRLITRILQIATNPGDLVLDSFAGSGTTGHTVLKLNQEDGDDRRFILVEMEPEIARAITSERLKRAIAGYEWAGQRGKVNREEGLGGGFRFCELGPTLFDAQGQIRDVVSFSDLAHHVFFTETGEPLPQDATSETVLLGAVDGVAVYLLYNGVLEDKSTDGGNVLTQSVLAGLPPHNGPRVIYGNGCMLSSAYLREVGVTFRQIPYEIKIR
jgi:site-specific DNA-methyltransferase (adenine-specific)/adenine-specific DNA-methyltransferase